MDQGIIPAIAPTLKDYFGFNSTAIGSLGSCIYLGATAGSALAIPFLDLVPTRWALIICTVLQMMALYAFTYTEKWAWQASTRFLSGAC